MKTFTKFAKVIFAFLTLLLVAERAQSQVVINELRAPNIIELKNIGNTSQDVSNYWLCNRPAYIQLSSNSLSVNGDLDLEPGEIVVITGFNTGMGDTGEMALYTSSSFSSSSAIVDYVIWGDDGSTRTTTAVQAGIWTDGQFAPTFSDTQSLQYFGSDNLASNYSTLAPTIGGANCNPEAGTVSLDGAATTQANPSTSVDGNTAIICIDSDSAPVTVTKTGHEMNLSYRYVITDDQNIILNIVNTNSIDLTGAGVGTCRIWGWSYRGTPNNGLDFVGDSLSDLDAVNCSDISENWVTVIRVAPKAGTVSLDGAATTQANPTTAVDGNTAIICIDSDSAPVTVTKTGHEMNLSYRYVITDDQNTILNIVNTNSIDLTGAGVGTCRIWGWSYRGTPNNGLDFVGDSLSDLDAVNCSDISENWVTVIRVAPEAGTVSLDGVATTQANPSTSVDGNTAIICIDSDSAPVTVTKTGHEMNLSYRYVITDDQNTILNIVNTNSIDLTGAGVGTCRIWGWSYRGTPNNGLDFVGDPLSDLDAVNCSDISDNWVTVIRVAPEAGTVSIDSEATGNPNGTTSINGNTARILVDNQADPIVVTKTGYETNLSYRYVITDDQNTILNIVNTSTIDLDGAGVGTCRIWGWSYRGTPNNGLGFVGSPIGDLDAVNCSDISENWVTVERVDVEEPQIVINETDGDSLVQLKNIGTASVNIGNYWLCNFPSYSRIGTLQIEGDLDLAPGETVNILNFTAINRTDSELGLYSTNSFGSSAAIVDYIEWGSTGHQRSSVAVAAGTWTQGDFIASIPENDFIIYDGSGDAATDYIFNATLSSEDFVANDLVITFFPNPVVDSLTISNLNFSIGDVVNIYNLSGQVLISQKLDTIESVIDFNDFSAGAYILEYLTNSGDSTIRKVVKQ